MTEHFQSFPGDPTVRQNRPVTCRACGACNEAATHTRLVTGRVPKNGDVSLCAVCGEISVFVIGPLGVAMREPSMDELAAIIRDHGDVIAARNAWRAENPRNPRPSDPDA